VLLSAALAQPSCGGADDAGRQTPAAATVDRDREGDAGASPRATAAGDTEPPPEPVRLVFIHHSVGEQWLADDGGQLGLTLMDNNYFVSDTNYGWCPDGCEEAIGDTTDIGHWYDWFVGPGSGAYLAGLYGEDGQNSEYSRLDQAPEGENEIIMFKSCYPNSGLGRQRR